MDQLHLLLLLSFSMLIGSFLSGTIPMAFKMSDSKSRLLALMGSGILVGTALAIIIPEGVDSLYASQGEPLVENDDKNPKVGANELAQTQDHAKTFTIGISLVAGFVLMLFIDQFSIYRETHIDEKAPASQHNYSLASQNDDIDISYEEDNKSFEEFNTINETRPIRDNEMHRISIRSQDVDDSQNRTLDTPSPSFRRSIGRTNNTKVTPTLGLVIHASADGIALGAAATTSHRDVEMIIFLAIMLHKAPAAFSLVVFLLHRGLKHTSIRRHLLAFSLSAPLAALLTYFGLSQSSKEALRQNNATGIAMLFSAGTFLYVATVHVLPELVHNKLLEFKELLFFVGGAFLPIVLAQSI